MKRTVHFVRSEGTVSCTVAPGRTVRAPVIPGILKHPSPQALHRLLAHPAALRKYTTLALQKSAWPILAQFPRDWLNALLPSANVRPARRRALEFLLGAH